MSLSWNEIKTRAAAFVLEWPDADSQRTKEKAEAQTFEAEFLNIFGVNRKKAALFEHEIRFADGEHGYIVTCWYKKAAQYIQGTGILTSTIHMAWTRYVCGRLKSDYRYSKDIVYNNFPWPNPTEKQTTEIERLTQEVLDIRTKFPNSSLADLYDPVAMPPALVKAHQKLDKAVEAAYGRIFTDDSQRVAFLFELYQRMVGELFVRERVKR